MSPRKLSEGDRTEILDLYRNTDATSSTLADRYGVSNSTVSRFLKNSLSQEEYDSLIQQKRLARSNSKNKKANSSIAQSEKPTPKKTKSSSKDQKIEESADTTQNETTSSNETTSTSEEIENPIEKPILKQKESVNVTSPEPLEEEDIDDEDDQQDLESVNTVKEMFGEEIVDEDDEEEFDDEDEDYEDYDEINAKPQIKVQELTVLPLSQAKFNRNCYLAIDRTAELMTRPLKDFAELGKIPQEEVNQKTLPIFDNHRVAKRFCDRRGKVIKLPDTKIIEKTAPCLKSKGITRILMNGKVFNINGNN
ncbi:hypothetical protein Cyast_1586 [Cyanobacterium stanieri PCC 7202]|uniref:Transposase n=1 Tax=Cyanobacterium stanieri (strain ATCC 29140 / PCC 7202) TaxID=292563 RepID=K9YM35_CYASC|nr:hypothetical protein Cyast_1586 [Cyanobacterium stanieri PCC 7202]